MRPDNGAPFLEITIWVMRKIAFLFLTYGDLRGEAVWRRFFEEAPAESYRIYVHPKSPEQVTSPWLRSYIIPAHVATSWGGIGCIEANHLLLREALKDPANSKFVLVSDSCLPLYSFSYIRQELLSDDMMWMHFYEGCQYRWQALTPHPQTNVSPFVTYSQFLKNNAQGLIFNREMARWYLRHQLWDAFLYMPSADEHYFINVLIHVGYDYQKDIRNRRGTYSNWREPERGGASPKTYHQVDQATIDAIRADPQKPLFFRKVASDATVAIDYLLCAQNASLTDLLHNKS